jgi:hypothetical protein
VGVFGGDVRSLPNKPSSAMSDDAGLRKRGPAFYSLVGLDARPGHN